MNAPAKRPSLAKKSSRKEKEKQDSILDNGVKITINGKDVQVLAGDLNALHVRALRREVGVTFPALVAALESSYSDIDLMAALIWLRRIIDGDDVSYDEVAAETGYDILDDVEVVQVDTAEPSGDDVPEE